MANHNRNDILKKVQEVAASTIQRIDHLRGYIDNGNTRTADAYKLDIMDEIRMMKQAIFNLNDPDTGEIVNHLNKVLQELSTQPLVARQHLVDANSGLIDFLKRDSS